MPVWRARYISLTISPLNPPSASESQSKARQTSIIVLAGQSLSVCLQKKCLRITFLCKVWHPRQQRSGAVRIRSRFVSSGISVWCCLLLNAHKPKEFCIWSYSSPKVSSKLTAAQVVMTGNVCSEKSSYNIQLACHRTQPTDLQSSKIQKIHAYLFSFMIPYFFVGDKRREKSKRDKEWWTDTSGQILLSVKGRCF